jgi:AraC family transcriptional regulator, ethanolamine operon transcriptional activator
MTKPPFTKRSVELHDFSPEQLLEVVHGARLEHYLLTRSKCDARLDRWSMGNFTVDIGRYSFPVRAVGTFSEKRLCVGYMRGLTDTTWVNGFKVGRDTIEFYPAGSELNYRAAPNGEWVAIEFDEEAFQSAARLRLGREVDLPWKHVMSFRVTDTERRAIDQVVRRLWRHPLSGTLMIGPILGAIAEVMDGLPRKTSGVTPLKLLRTQAVLRRADAHLRANLTNHFDLRTLADAAGTTARTLQRAFTDAYGVTPQQWARCFALHRVRERLRAADGHLFTVEGIANECGFQHMGRFAEYYRELFGELPSETLSE